MHWHLPVRSSSFSGHESFPLRFAWLKKGFDNIDGDPEFFSSHDAMVKLGVGKNMVRAIRHWGLACQIWDEEALPPGQVLPRQMGHDLFGTQGADPYLEDIGTIWWLHWCLATNGQRATSWSYLFSRPRGNRFRKAALVQELLDYAHEQRQTKSSWASIKRDVDVLIRSYTTRGASDSRHVEDDLDSPFSLLGLIRPALDKDEYELVQRDHASLPTTIVAAALVDYCAWDGVAYTAVNLAELMYAPLSPGRVFRLSEDGLMRHLHALTELDGPFELHETAGIRQVLVHGPLPDRRKALADHYRAAGEEGHA